LFSTKEPLNIGHFCGKWPIKIRDPMSLRHPVWLICMEYESVYEKVYRIVACIYILGRTILFIYTRYDMIFKSEIDTNSIYSAQRVGLIHIHAFAYAYSYTLLYHMHINMSKILFLYIYTLNMRVYMKDNIELYHVYTYLDKRFYSYTRDVIFPLIHTNSMYSTPKAGCVRLPRRSGLFYHTYV